MRALILFTTLAATAMSFDAQSVSIAGSWTLDRADKILPGGKQVSDYGAEPHGIAIFTEDGRYAVEIFRSERTKFASKERATGTPEEYRDAIMSTSAHFGRYAVDAQRGTITFAIDRASFPNWDETTRTSAFTLQGDTLSWRGSPRPDGSCL